MVAAHCESGGDEGRTGRGNARDDGGRRSDGVLGQSGGRACLWVSLAPSKTYSVSSFPSTVHQKGNEWCE